MSKNECSAGMLFDLRAGVKQSGVEREAIAFHVESQASTIEQLERDKAELEKALHNMTEHYADLINSGDAGNWNPEEEPVVISAREQLSKHTTKTA